VLATQTWIDGLQARAEAMQRHVHAAMDRDAQHLDRIAQRLARPSQAVRAQRHRLNALAHRLASHPVRLRSAQGLRLQQAANDIRQAARQVLTLQSHRLALVDAQLRSADPRHVLARGYAWLGNEAGQAVTSVRQLDLGDLLQVVLKDGAAGVQVTQLPEPTS